MRFKMNLPPAENHSLFEFSEMSTLANWSDGKHSSNQTEGNATSEPLDLTRAVTVGIILGAFIVFAVVGNILVILSVACHRHLRTPTNYFIVNLAIADLLLSLTVLPFSATREILNHWVLGRIFCDLWAAVDVLCCTASIISLCVISIDRYIGVRYSLRYPTIVTRKKALLALLAVWIFSMVISIGPLLGWKEPAPSDDKVCIITEELFYVIFSSLCSFYIPLTVLLVMYCRVYVVAKRITKNLEAGEMKEGSDSKELTLRIHSKNIHGDSFNSKPKGHHPRGSLSLKLLKFSREKKAAKTLGIVVGFFVLCWLPFFLTLPVGAIFPVLKPTPPLNKIIFWLGYFNSCINPIIYPCFSKEFKRAFIRILKCQCHRRKQPRWWAYHCRNWNHVSFDHSRKDSLDDSTSYLNGSQRTLASGTHSPGYLSKLTHPKVAMGTFQDWEHSNSNKSPPLHLQSHKDSVFAFQVIPEQNGHRTDHQISDQRAYENKA
uniref:Alpha-1B adrenergic receptor n=1 Tax=Geotrypetes seraphini TaxID=260995 RepID=A0A6P8PPE3_GEOSA|nr:alpha-1B adrenergic receptor [Geotrypetes seraphini]